MVGEIESSDISNVYATGKVVARLNQSYASAGGLVAIAKGHNDTAYRTDINNSYAAWSVAPQTHGDYNGGLLGWRSGNSPDDVYINNEGTGDGFCEYITEITPTVCTLSEMVAIQNGGTNEAWSSDVWSGLGSATPTLKNMPSF